MSKIYNLLNKILAFKGTTEIFEILRQKFMRTLKNAKMKKYEKDMKKCHLNQFAFADKKLFVFHCVLKSSRFKYMFVFYFSI